ncbi:MAG: phospho-N-acetylmuramoyl-pentapeptide-transferase [Armatimonadota bacterium]
MPLDIIIVILPFLIAFVVSMLFAPGVIASLKRQKLGQVISEDGPESHLSKAGTPTMGGIIILAGILAGVLFTVYVFNNPEFIFSGELKKHDLLAVVILMLSYAVLGIIDDVRTINPVNGVRGIASKPKAVVQFLISAMFLVWVAFFRPEGFNAQLRAGDIVLLSGATYWIFSLIFMVGFINFVNITDGCDGLVSGLMAILCSAMIYCAIRFKPIWIADADLSLYPIFPAIVGGCLAFLWFNANPAKVFMGDSGSLALGAGVVAASILTHRELLLIICGSIFILDGLSSALQWAVFKITRISTGTGKRVFKKSPIHHHFELSGWAEPTVVIRMWILGIIAGMIGIAGALLKIW